VETVLVRKVKRPIGNGLWAAYRLAEDEYGTWLYVPRGSIYRGTDGRTSGVCQVGQGDRRPMGVECVHLAPRDGWWFASWGLGLISIDISGPPVFAAGECSYVDLEIDLTCRARVVEIWDEDEFEDARRDGWISAAEGAAALSATARVAELMRTGREPFGRLGWDRLAAANQLRLRPLVNEPFTESAPR
jgi:hypothetical protein